MEKRGQKELKSATEYGNCSNPKVGKKEHTAQELKRD
jgi:hypothetical protein